MNEYIPLNTGSVPNDGTGDSLRVSMQKIQSNFETLWSYGNHRHRQSILECSKDVSGNPSFISSSNLQIFISGSIMCSIMNGVSSRGEDNIFVFSTGSIISASSNLYPSTTNLLYISVDSSSMDSTLEVTTASYYDQYFAPNSPSEHDIFIDRIKYKTFKWISGSWSSHPLIAIARIETNVGGVTSIKYMDENEELIRARRESVKYSLVFG